MSKTVPELGQTVKHFIGTAAQIGVHGFPFAKLPSDTFVTERLPEISITKKGGS
jgi:hypothetical protein